MSAVLPPDDPPPYDDPEGDDVKKLVQPTIHVLAGQSIHPESADAAPLYRLNRGVAKLTYATPEVELRRVDHAIHTDSSGEPDVRSRSRHVYDLKHNKGIHGTRSSLPPDSPPIFINAISRRQALGDFALKKSLLRSHWRAVPVDASGKRSKYNFP